MSNKPKSFAELIRYLTINPFLELHMPASSLIVHGNTGQTDLSQPARIMNRKFIKKSCNSLVFQYTDGEKVGQNSWLQYDSTKEFSFFDDRFEVADTHGSLKYYYKN